jgi:hypothetical protein
MKQFKRSLITTKVILYRWSSALIFFISFLFPIDLALHSINLDRVFGGQGQSPNFSHEAAMKIVDAHHHLWDLQSNYYPWLTDQITRRACGDYAAIRRDYLIGDYRRDIDELEVVTSVHTQAEHDPSDPVRETRWLQSIADDRNKSAGLPQGIVAYADLSVPDVKRTLEAHLNFANMRGIRQSLNGILNDAHANKDLLHDQIWRSNLALVGRLGLSFDLQLYPRGYRRPKPQARLPRRIAIRGKYTKSFATKNKFSRSAPEVTSGLGQELFLYPCNISHFYFRLINSFREDPVLLLS